MKSTLVEDSFVVNKPLKVSKKMLPKTLHDVVTQSRPKRRSRTFPIPAIIISLFVICNQLILFMSYYNGVSYFLSSGSIKESNEIVLATPRVNFELKSLHQDIMMINKKLDSLRAHNYAQKQNEIALHNNFNDLDARIFDALDLYDADKIGLKDYALETLGGSITSTPDTTAYPSGKLISLFGITVNEDSNPSKILQAETKPGECYSFYGSSGRIRIHLSHKIKITAITLEHAHFSLVEDISSAPKDFVVYGLEDENSEIPDIIGDYTYSLQHKSLQIFEVKEQEDKVYEHVELFIKNNHGHKEFTSVYRFRVHGCRI